MYYSIIAAILLSTIALSSSNSFLNNERKVFGRFYSDYAELYRPATLKTYVDQEQTIERYEFFFTENEFSEILEKSITMLYTNVIEQTITYHPMPNFEVNGSRYFYRRDPHQIDPIEIELVNSEDLLFRDVQKPNRYFYLSSIDELEYSSQVPVMPYYEVTFICNSSYSKDNQVRPPILSYISDNFQCRYRYLLDWPLFGTGKQSQMYAYADIRNIGEQSFVIQGAELVLGDASLHPTSAEHLHTGLSNFGIHLSEHTTHPNLTHPFGEHGSGAYVHKLPILSSITLPPHSSKLLKDFEPNVTIEPFCYYISVFHPKDSNGTLLNACNLTSFNEFIPNGRLLLREQGRYVGQIHLPDLSFGETYTMIFGYDSDVTYHRKVTIIEGDETSDSIIYYVEYVFENSNSTHDVPISFIESFSAYKYYHIKSISTSNDTPYSPDLTFHGTDLRGYIVVPCQGGRKMISYNLIVYRYKPRFYV